MDICTNLKKIRAEKGMSQTELAEKTGLQPCAISHFESGRRRPNVKNLLKLATALGVSTDSLLQSKGLKHDELGN